MTNEERLKFNTANAERFKTIYRVKIKRPGAEELLTWLESTDFFTAPASTKYHGAYPGGLVDHSLRVYGEMMNLGEIGRLDYYAELTGTSLSELEESAAICGLLHDVCKADFYEPKSGGGYQVKDRFPFGHGEKSVFLIERHMRLTDAEALAIRWHMGAFDDAARGGSRTLSAARAFSPLVYELSAADMRATHDEQWRERDE